MGGLRLGRPVQHPDPDAARRQDRRALLPLELRASANRQFGGGKRRLRRLGQDCDLVFLDLPHRLHAAPPSHRDVLARLSRSELLRLLLRVSYKVGSPNYITSGLSNIE